MKKRDMPNGYILLFLLTNFKVFFYFTKLILELSFVFQNIFTADFELFCAKRQLLQRIKNYYCGQMRLFAKKAVYLEVQN